MSKERPILFSGEMVRAIREGRKTQTRRVAKFPQWVNPDEIKSFHQDLNGGWVGWSTDEPELSSFTKQTYKDQGFLCPYGQIGDRLWVREAHAIVPRSAYAGSDISLVLRPDDDYEAAIFRADWSLSDAGIQWRPSIHMPRWASRLTLEITNVRLERLQDIRNMDAIEEGVFLYAYKSHIDSFRAKWDAINAKRGYSWDSNPWVWAAEFKEVQ